MRTIPTNSFTMVSEEKEIKKNYIRCREKRERREDEDGEKKKLVLLSVEGQTQQFYVCSLEVHNV